MNSKYSIALVCAIALSGCTTTDPRDYAILTVYSEPAGAYISSIDGTHQGTSPFLVHITSKSIQDGLDKDGCFTLYGYKAHWASGATAEFKNPKYCNSQINGDYSLTINRPVNFPDIQKDLDLALRINQIEQERRAADADRQALSNAAFLNYLSSRNNITPTAPPPTNLYIKPMTNCYTTQRYGTYHTTCN